jgi:hypothetical protein
MEVAMKLEVGKKYELNNGEVCECTEMKGEDPLVSDDYGYGPFVINSCLYHQDGRFGTGSFDSDLDVYRCVEDTPPTWGEMTDAEKGALLLAHHEGKAIQICNLDDQRWIDASLSFFWNSDFAYRVRPEPTYLPLEAGRKYSTASQGDWECILVRDGKAWLTRDLFPAYLWDAETGNSISLNKEYNVAGFAE